jgi:hypothetical protein
VSEEQHDTQGQEPISSMDLMKAAQIQVKSLQDEVKEGRKQARLTKIQVRILGAVAAILLAVVGILGAVAGQNANLNTQLHQEVVQSCQTGNQQRAQEIKVWDTFIDLILKGNTSSSAAAEGKQFKEFISQVYAPRNCAQAYTVSDGSADAGINP